MGVEVVDKKTRDAILEISTFGAFYLTSEVTIALPFVSKLTLQQLIIYPGSFYWITSFLINFMSIQKPDECVEAG